MDQRVVDNIMASDDSDIENHQCVPFKSDVNTLDSGEIYEILKGKKGTVSSCIPPVKPRGGSVFVYDLGAEEQTWNMTKKKLR